MKNITFKCKSKDHEITSIIICILLFIAGWMVSSAIARTFGDNLFITVAIPTAFLVCGVIFMNKRNKAQSNDGTAQFSDSGKVKLCFGGRSVVFDCKDIRNVYYMRDTLVNDEIGNGYILVIKLPFRSYRIFSESLTQGITGFENTELYAVYLELKDRLSAYGESK